MFYLPQFPLTHIYLCVKLIRKQKERIVAMSDMERYGDYNDTQDEYEYDDDGQRKTKWISLILKITIFTLSAIIVAFLGFRIWLFNYYPASVSDIVFTDSLLEHYNSLGGSIDAKTQDIRFPYDDNKLGNFFAENLIVVFDAGNLQITIRYNESAIKDIEERYGIKGLDASDPNLFSFRLYRNNDDVPEGEEQNPDYQFTDAQIVGEVEYVKDESLLMYHYKKIVFKNVDFGNVEAKDGPRWLALAIYVNGAPSDEMYSQILIYENNPSYAVFTDYPVSVSTKGD